MYFMETLIVNDVISKYFHSNPIRKLALKHTFMNFYTDFRCRLIGLKLNY